MPAQYTLEPGLPDGAVRVTDPSIGLSRVLYDPAKSQELKTQQSTGGNTQPWNGQMYDPGGDETPGPFDQPGASTTLPPAAPPMGATPPAVDRPLASAPSMLAPRGSTAIPAPPPAPAGTQLHKADITPGTPGQGYDLNAEDARHEGLVDRKLAMQGQNDKVQAVLRDQQIQLQQQQADDQRRQEEEGRKRLRYEQELETVKQETGPMSNLGALSSVALGLVGLFMAKRSQNPGMALSRMNQSLDSAISKDIEIQRHQHDSTINRLTQQLGNAQQAELMYRGNVRRLALDRVKNNMTRLGEDAGTDQLMRAAEGEVQTIDDQAKTASFNKPGTAKYEFEQPKPVKGAAASFVPTDESSRQLQKMLGPKFQEMYEKGMDSKVTSGQSPQTVQTALPSIHQMNDDLSTLQSLAKENGGHIPTKGVINIPQFAVGKLAQMGVKSGMQAEEANQLIQNYLSQKARSYGGVITDSDRDQAEREMGASGDGLIRGVTRLRTTLNNGVRQALATHFRGNAQNVLNIALRDYGSAQGVEDAAPEPFDVHGGTAPAQAPSAGPPNRGANAKSAASDTARRLNYSPEQQQNYEDYLLKEPETSAAPREDTRPKRELTGKF